MATQEMAQILGYYWLGKVFINSTSCDCRSIYHLEPGGAFLHHHDINNNDLPDVGVWLKHWCLTPYTLLDPQYCS